MHNTFINRHFDWDGSRASRQIKLANRALQLIGKRARVRAPLATGWMTTIEQRINLFHFISEAIAHDVPGDFVELGTFEGETAVLISKVLHGEGAEGRRLHVYDAFEPIWQSKDPLHALTQNFAQHALELPVIHRGWFEQTIPAELPEQIAFVHVDAGIGGDPETHERVLRDVMSHIYPRMSRGAICSIVDYCDPALAPEAENAQPGVRIAFDKFMQDKPEPISVLYAGEFGHAYFRKR